MLFFLSTDENEIKPSTRGLAGLKGRRRVYEAPKPQFYYHMEYKLLPDEADPLKTDVVTYGVAAKVYIESDSKILKTWNEGKKTWIAWTHRYILSFIFLCPSLGTGHYHKLPQWQVVYRISIYKKAIARPLRDTGELPLLFPRSAMQSPGLDY